MTYRNANRPNQPARRFEDIDYDLRFEAEQRVRRLWIRNWTVAEIRKDTGLFSTEIKNHLKDYGFMGVR